VELTFVSGHQQYLIGVVAGVRRQRLDSVPVSGAEIETSAIYWAHFCRFLLKTEKEFSLRNVVLSKSNVQNCHEYNKC
jgi:hypothetical protein